MDSPRFIMHQGARVLLLDYSGASSAQLPALLGDAERLIRDQPPRSLLLLTRMRDTEFSSEANKLLLEHLDGNGPYARASAVVGLGHLAKAIPIANRLSGRSLEAFSDETKALDWLAAQRPAEREPEPEPVGFVEREGCRIIRIDFRRTSKEELLERIDLAAKLIRSQPPRTVLTLTLVHGVTYDKDTTAAIKEYVAGNRPYVLAGAVVGLDYLRQILLPLNRLTGRNLRAFDDEETAVNWLAAEKRRLVGA